MKSKIALSVTLIFILMQVISCGSNGFIPVTGEDTPNTKVGGEVNKAKQEVIGIISKIRKAVRVGTREKLELLEGDGELKKDNFIKITDGGKARLEFPGPISLLLYNQSDLDGIKLEFDENSNPRMVNRLIRGGFSGYVEPGSHLTVDLAFGVQVNILGTHFFVIHDERNGLLTIGKFEGTLIVSVPGQQDISLMDSELIDITQNGNINHFSSITFTPAQFDEAADSCYFPSEGVNILRRDNNIPLAGEITTDKTQKLPCAPLSPITPSPEPVCQTPIGYVKSKIAKMREGPDLRFNTVGEYKAGDQFTVLGHYQYWYQARFPNGQKGWLYIDWIVLPQDLDINNVCSIPYEDLPPTPTPKPRPKSTP